MKTLLEQNKYCSVCRITTKQVRKDVTDFWMCTRCGTILAINGTNGGKKADERNGVSNQDALSG